MATSVAAPPRALDRGHPYRTSVAEYRTFRDQGFLVVPGLVPDEDVAELLAHTEDIIHQRVAVPGNGFLPPGASVQEIERRYVRIHMLHREMEIQERYLLHPRILDVLEALIGPDVLAMQTMLFLKPPGAEGQGYHQDSYYIPTLPDSLCGAWLALDRADAANGCLHFTVGSQHEPIYPDADNRRGHYPAGELAGLSIVSGVSHTDENCNGLTPIAARYAGREVRVEANPGDVVFFGGHVLHRSFYNETPDRFRRAFVGHYANARSYTQWGGGNAAHILARGRTHLPFAQPRFGTPCAANTPPDSPRAVLAPTMMAAGEMMAAQEMTEERLDPAAHEH